MMQNTRSLINEIKSIILKYANPTRIYLYGSQANGTAKEGSDIDIAYDDENFTQSYLIDEDINNIKTLVKIDVQNISKAGDRFKNRVKSTGKVLFSSTKKLRAEDGLYNFSNALDRYINVCQRENDFKSDGFEDVYLDLVVKRFEFTYEMSWKSLKRYLEFLGLEVKNPRMTFKEGYTQGILKDEEIWLDMIEQRNISSHICDEYEIKEILDKKDEYKNAFIDLRMIMTTSLQREY
ncbi:MAG: HI0074 family nucleotidyltransferase substrate-binding subunit [Sulfurimonas sp.]|nr:HI0074 family nucleotidyltransferase substrate-binding subunit [Sulfurimonas sp.]